MIQGRSDHDASTVCCQLGCKVYAANATEIQVDVVYQGHHPSLDICRQQKIFGKLVAMVTLTGTEHAVFFSA